jgi:hypothetical protein
MLMFYADDDLQFYINQQRIDIYAHTYTNAHTYTLLSMNIDKIINIVILSRYRENITEKF